jgi:hypothetical protein
MLLGLVGNPTKNVLADNISLDNKKEKVKVYYTSKNLRTCKKYCPNEKPSHKKTDQAKKEGK